MEKKVKSLSCVRLFATSWTDCSLPGSSLHRIFQTRILEWAAISKSCNYATVETCENNHFLIIKRLSLICHSPDSSSHFTSWLIYRRYPCNFLSFLILSELTSLILTKDALYLRCQY